jgi:ATP-dependent DNA helicase 2 subunit 1
MKGSTKVFRALWEKCVEREKAVICSCTLRKKSAPKLVALIPQEEVPDQDQDVMRFDGFRMVQIPYAGDVRDLKLLEKEAPEIDDSESAPFKDIIRKLTFKCGYKPSLFENPVIRTIYSSIEATCYEKEMEEIEDAVQPDTEMQDRKIAKFIPNITEMFGDLSVETSGTKRKAPTQKGDGAGNRPKVPKGDITSDQILDAIRNDAIKGVTVPQLKTCLAELGYTGLSKLNKDALIQKFKEYHGI